MFFLVLAFEKLLKCGFLQTSFIMNEVLRNLHFRSPVKWSWNSVFLPFNFISEKVLCIRLHCLNSNLVFASLMHLGEKLSWQVNLDRYFANYCHQEENWFIWIKIDLTFSKAWHANDMYLKFEWMRIEPLIYKSNPK